jgi:hypothetical protein
MIHVSISGNHFARGFRTTIKAGRSWRTSSLGLKDPKKVKRYPDTIKAYQKFVGKKHLAWFKPPSALWSYGGLTVRVNPELGLHFDGKKHVVKLYFKEERPTKQRLNVVLAMMRVSLSLGEDAVPAVLDVSNCRLIMPRPVEPDLLPMLQAQAIAFVHMWNAVSARPVAISAASNQ